MTCTESLTSARSAWSRAKVMAPGTNSTMQAREGALTAAYENGQSLLTSPGAFYILTLPKISHTVRFWVLGAGVRAGRTCKWGLGFRV